LDDETVLVAFELPAAVAATSVNLVGEFNGWSPGTHPLHLLDDGSFRTELPLPAGHRWRFRYLIDGERWENDWAADDYVPNGLGTDDSVVDLTDTIPLAAVAGDAAAWPGDADTTAGPAPKRRWWQLRGRRPLTAG
jgi:1,4-alpha-glucan branching enzyme